MCKDIGGCKMNSVLLVVIVMTLMCLVMASDVDNQNVKRKANRLGIVKLPTKIAVTTRPIARVPKPGSKPARKTDAVAVSMTNKLPIESEDEKGDFAQLLKQAELRGRRKKTKRSKKMKRALMALLLAYKIKFAALIPGIIGGLILLVMTTGLAGFFFALFAAVLGLKST